MYEKMLVFLDAAKDIPPWIHYRDILGSLPTVGKKCMYTNCVDTELLATSGLPRLYTAGLHSVILRLLRQGEN